MKLQLLSCVLVLCLFFTGAITFELGKGQSTSFEPLSEGTNWEYCLELSGESNTTLHGHRTWFGSENGQCEIIEFSPSMIIIKEVVNYFHSEKSTDEGAHQYEFSGTYIYSIDRESLIFKEVKFYDENGTEIEIYPNPEGKPALQIISTEGEEGSSIIYYGGVSDSGMLRHYNVSYEKLDFLGDKIPVITLRYSGSTRKDLWLGVNGTGDFVYHFEKSTGLLISYSYDTKIESEKGTDQYGGNWKMNSISWIPKKETATQTIVTSTSENVEPEPMPYNPIEHVGYFVILILILVSLVVFIPKLIRRRKKNSNEV